MDTSVQYIEMCRKAVEIQDSWEQRFGDLTNFGFLSANYLKNAHGSILYDGRVIIKKERKDKKIGFGSEWEIYESKDVVWLPRQDQLQEMLYTEDIPRAWDLFTEFDVFICQYSRDTNDYDKSAEQLWLMYIMHEKYQKKWDGKGWA